MLGYDIYNSNYLTTSSLFFPFIQYQFKENGGQGFARNLGFEIAKGDYFVIFDSDAIIPPHYFEAVEKYLNTTYVDAFGGPDAAHESFTPMQKAISYSMTSFFTTGGIRGREKHVGQFHPRSFNMGLSREVYEKVGGFIITRMGEDIEFSIAYFDISIPLTSMPGIIDIKSFIMKPFAQPTSRILLLFDNLYSFSKSGITGFQYLGL